MARTKEKWKSSFSIAKESFRTLSELENQGGTKLLLEGCVSYRNPIIFDNNVSESSFKLPFYIEGNKSEIPIISTLKKTTHIINKLTNIIIPK
jgi:hypothetical protein